MWQWLVWIILKTRRMELLSRTRSTNDDNNNKRQKIRTRAPSPRKRGDIMKQEQPPAETEEGLERIPLQANAVTKWSNCNNNNRRKKLERWKVEVFARFIRALHELDYLGFIKHTKRNGKADHMLRELTMVSMSEFFNITLFPSISNTSWDMPAIVLNMYWEKHPTKIDQIYWLF